ncbi:hypothetical protein ONZ45_g4428 [Pleurotus djamor]|nr:hypothetical protein ONZ45_g4428 [Pleurotus djamor]
MYSYVGKLNYAPYSSNETFAMIFPQGFVFGADVVMYHQWTRNAEGVPKATSATIGRITTASTSVNGFRLKFSSSHFSYDVSVSQNKKKLTAKMFDTKGEHVADLALELHYSS